MKKLSFAAALLAATVLSGAASAKTLVYCSEGSPEGFDPGLYTAGTTFDASSRPVYNRLVEFTPGTTQTEPGLAESWEVSDDGLKYTFKLRENAKWSNGDPVTAHDFVGSFKRILTPSLGAEYAYMLWHVVGAEDYYRGAFKARPAAADPESEDVR